MKRKQIFNQLQENQWISQEVFLNLDSDLTQSFISLNQEDYITQKLKDILATLQQEKNEFMIFHHRQKEALVEKINSEKDKIIEDLLKSIHNLKKQNEQLKFQYRKRFKVIKNIEQKYDNLILSKSKKITEYQSILKYLETKIKFLQKKLEKYQARERIQNSRNKQFFSPKYEKTYLSPNKNRISLIVSKQIKPKDSNKKRDFRNSLDQFTIPLTASLVSESKVSSSSKTIARKKVNTRSQIDDIWRLKGDFIENDVYSSFLTSTDRNFYENKIDTQTNLDDVSGISPVCLENAEYKSKYLSLDYFDELADKQQKISDCPTQKSYRMKSPKSFQKMYKLN